MLAFTVLAMGLIQTYTNPVYLKDYPDPFVLESKGKFYAYATGFRCMESDDLVNWTPKGQVLRAPWSKEHYWAPEVVARKNKFYMTYSARNPETKKHDIGIAVADQPTGPFEHKAILVKGDDNKVGVIDATIYQERGSAFLLYSEEEPRRIVLKKLSKDWLSTEEKTVEIVKPDRRWEKNVTEAPTLIKRNGIYHLFFSVGWYESSKKDASYAVCHATAKSLEGPYVKDPEPLLKTIPDKVYSPGHQCLIKLKSGEWWMVYHGWNNEGEPRYRKNPHGRMMYIDRLEWKGDIPTIEGPTTTPKPAPNLAKEGR
jgi:beta-xylosidase